MNIYVLYIAIGVLLFYHKEIVNGATNIISDLMKSDIEKLNEFLGGLVEEIVLYTKGLTVSKGEVLATIYHESKLKILSQSNGSIIGDKSLNNKAYGVMQVRYPALTDVNNNFGWDFTIHDLLDLKNNIAVGSAYLSLCKDQARRENPANYKTLMFKKYNAGIGTSIESERGELYSELSLKYLTQFNNIV